jgi:phage baseplate assembly protein W
VAELKVPFALDATGALATTADPLVMVRQHLITYISTYPGERVMRPTFGTPLLDLVFEAGDVMLAETIRMEVQQAVARDVPDVSLLSFTVSGSEADGTVGMDGVLNIGLDYAQSVGTVAGSVQSTTLTAGG